MQIVYVVLLSAVKASMLCFYLRIFVTPYVQMVSKIGLAVVALWAIAYLCACIFLCNPIEAQWTGVGKCGTYMAMIQSLIAYDLTPRTYVSENHPRLMFTAAQTLSGMPSLW